MSYWRANGQPGQKAAHESMEGVPYGGSAGTFMLAPGKVREGAVGFCHAVGIFTLLYSGTLAVVGVNELCCNAVSHRNALAGAGSSYKPHGSQVVLALAFYLERNLVVRTTNTAG